MKISVIIPTYNRKDLLKKCILSFYRQDYPRSNYEILIVDDGSTDGTGEIVLSLPKDPECLLRLVTQKNKGPAAARNLGIKHARGDILLFTGDDIIATADLIKHHDEMHQHYPDDHVAVLGHVVWSPEIRITPLMRWIESSGVQFGYSTIVNPDDVPFNYFYTSNVSVKKRFLETHGLFDEDFPYAAWEDIELAFRLSAKGLRIVYDAKAIAYHEHEVTRKTIGRRAQLAGRAMALFHQKHPETKETIGSVGDRRFKLLRSLPIGFLSSPILEWIPLRCRCAYYSCLVTKYVATGYRDQEKARRRAERGGI